MIEGLPKTADEVGTWAANLRKRRFNDEGRAAVDILEVMVRELVDGLDQLEGKPVERCTLIARMSKPIEMQQRVMIQADKTQADRFLVEQRRQQEKKDEAEEELFSIGRPKVH